MATFETNDGTWIYYNDWGKGQPIVFSHGWPLSADAFEDQMFYLASRGYRCIAHDRRGHGRSSQPWHGNDLDTYADDLAELVEKLDLKDADSRRSFHRRRRGRPLHRPARHQARGEGRADRRDPAAHAQDAGQSWRPFDRGVRSAARQRCRRPIPVLEGPELAVLWLQPAGREGIGGRAQLVLAARHDGGFPACYFCIKAFSETDLTEDLKKFDVPTLILHGDDDQIVPIGAAAMLSSKIVKGATLKVYQGAPHGMCTTLKDQVNEDLLAFIRS